MSISVWKKSLFSFRNQAQLLLTSCRNEYQSAYSLKKLYPNSSLKITTPDEKEVNEKSSPSQKFSGYIPLNKVEITACKSSGPGGQHVNAINTKATIRFHLESAEWIPADLRKRLLETKKDQLTKTGDLIIKSDKTRSYQLNVADVLQRLRTIIYNAEVVVKEPSRLKVIEIRRRKEKANEERLKQKRFKSAMLQSKRDYDTNNYE